MVRHISGYEIEKHPDVLIIRDRSSDTWALFLGGAIGLLFLSVCALLWWALLTNRVEDGQLTLIIFCVISSVAAVLWFYGLAGHFTPPIFTFQRADNALMQGKKRLCSFEAITEVQIKRYEGDGNSYLTVRLMCGNKEMFSTRSQNPFWTHAGEKEREEAHAIAEEVAGFVNVSVTTDY